MAQDEKGRQEVFSGVLQEVIKNLKGQPLFLFLLGVGILLLLGGINTETLRMVLFPLSALSFLGIIIWGFLEAGKLQRSKLVSGQINIAKSASLNKAELETGGISGARKDAQAKTGDIKVGHQAQLKNVKLKTGTIKLNDDADKRKEKNG